ncbi:MAG: hypothetical protein MZV63_70010 [Marinilabiliales bacterium]|nr:hypothetical protein [Marinilabiliales bacterium]
MSWAPEYWQPVVLSSYYGEIYTLRCLYQAAEQATDQLNGRQFIDEPGYYDVYCYVGKDSQQDECQRGRSGSPEADRRPRGQVDRAYRL